MTTSYPDRTSPVLRGKCLLNNIFGLPIPPPPPGVDTNLTENKPGAGAEDHSRTAGAAPDESDVQQLSFGDRSAGLCAGELRCDRRLAHDRRGREAGRCGGNHAEREKHSRAWRACGRCCWKIRSSFRERVTEKLMAYALGRRVEYYDRPAIRKIVHDAGAQNYKWSSIIVGIVKSPGFLMRSKA